MTARPLKILLAVEDRQNLRHCVRLLSAFGHEVSAAASCALAADRLRADRPDVLVAGGGDSPETALALFRAVAADGGARELYKLWITRDPNPADLLTALEAGADDFLASPIDAAELLARLRAAARVLELERRLAGLSQHDETTGLLNRRAFLTRLQWELRGAHRAGKKFACLVLQPDACGQLQELHGQPLVARATQELVNRLNEGQSRSGWGRVGEGRFAIALPASSEEARARAEELRADVAQAGFRAGNVELPWTISLGVAACDEVISTALELLERAEQALTLAEESGGNAVVTYDEVVEEERCWKELGGDRLFAGAVLRNIMMPCPRLLHTTDSLRHADAVLRQTKLPALPVVDEEGKLTGLLAADRARLDSAAENDEDTPITEAMNLRPVSFDEATSMAVMIDFFTHEAPPIVVVVHKGRPTGLVTPDSLATLVEPLSTASFAPADEVSGHAGLIVPQLCLAE